MTALTFQQFTASRQDMNEAEAIKALGLHPGDLGDIVIQPVAVFAGGVCYAHVLDDGRLMAPIYGAEYQGTADDAMWAIYWDFYLPECCIPDDLTLDILTGAYAEFCKREGLPHISADENLAELQPCQVMMPENFKDRAKIESLDWFLRIWNEVEDREADEVLAAAHNAADANPKEA